MSGPNTVTPAAVSTICAYLLAPICLAFFALAAVVACVSAGSLGYNRELGVIFSTPAELAKVEAQRLATDGDGAGAVSPKCCVYTRSESVSRAAFSTS